MGLESYVIVKPAHVFDRDQDWAALTSFATNQREGAMLGVVSGRRRQGKSFLLEALTGQSGGLYFQATEATEAVALREFTTELIAQGIPVRRPFSDWGDAIALLFSRISDEPRTVVIDEFPFLVKASPSLPSIIQRELGPGGSGRQSKARLLLCGSAMSVMGKLLAGQAPLRGRAGLEMVVRSFPYRDAAEFWEIDDSRLAVLTHSIVGGTPAYRREFVSDDTPRNRDDFDAWVTRTVLNRSTPLFREARYLLAEEADIRDLGLYNSVLAAVADGNTRAGGIASYVGRKASEIAHPLNVLEGSGFLVKEPDAFQRNRTRYRVTEPLITFYQAVMRPEWARLEAGNGEQVWRDQQATFLDQVVGPHFEALCREFALNYGAEVFGESIGGVAAGVVNDRTNRTQLEIDIAAFAISSRGGSRRVVSLGEAKWGQVMDAGHLNRLAKARDLLVAQGYDAADAVLACYSGAGFDGKLRELAEQDDRIALIDAHRLYGRR